MMPFVLKGKKLLPLESGPAPTHRYDYARQIWIDGETDVPLIVSAQVRTASSQFGETTITETREGTDQNESVAIQSSSFGETTMTKSMEGVDQPEGRYINASTFGETTYSASQEGIDRGERVDQEMFPSGISAIEVKETH